MNFEIHLLDAPVGQPNLLPGWAMLHANIWRATRIIEEENVIADVIIRYMDELHIRVLFPVVNGFLDLALVNHSCRIEYHHIISMYALLMIALQCIIL